MKMLADLNSYPKRHCLALTRALYEQNVLSFLPPTIDKAKLRCAAQQIP